MRIPKSARAVCRAGENGGDGMITAIATTSVPGILLARRYGEIVLRLPASFAGRSQDRGQFSLLRQGDEFIGRTLRDALDRLAEVKRSPFRFGNHNARQPDDGPARRLQPGRQFFERKLLHVASVGQAKLADRRPHEGRHDRPGA